jgi:polyhydroxyalkanoate synthesis regulator phasin
MSEDKGKREGLREGIRQGLGVLSAFKEAIEETISEARERGDLSPERAKEVMRGALDKAQEAAGSARDRFDFVTQKDFEELKSRVADLARRVGVLDGLVEDAQDTEASGDGEPDASSPGDDEPASSEPAEPEAPAQEDREAPAGP